MGNDPNDPQVSDNLIPVCFWLPDPPTNDNKGPLTVNDVMALLQPEFG